MPVQQIAAVGRGAVPGLLQQHGQREGHTTGPRRGRRRGVHVGTWCLGSGRLRGCRRAGSRESVPPADDRALAAQPHVQTARSRSGDHKPRAGKQGATVGQPEPGRGSPETGIHHRLSLPRQCPRVLPVRQIPRPRTASLPTDPRAGLTRGAHPAVTHRLPVLQHPPGPTRPGRVRRRLGRRGPLGPGHDEPTGPCGGTRVVAGAESRSGVSIAQSSAWRTWQPSDHPDT